MSNPQPVITFQPGQEEIDLQQLLGALGIKSPQLEAIEERDRLADSLKKWMGGEDWQTLIAEVSPMERLYLMLMDNDRAEWTIRLHRATGPFEKPRQSFFWGDVNEPDIPENATLLWERAGVAASEARILFELFQTDPASHPSFISGDLDKAIVMARI